MAAKSKQQLPKLIAPATSINALAADAKFFFGETT